jgi:Fur family peroxide stress response transcriptional regulator
MLREASLVPTIQRLAVLGCLSESRQHPTADQILSAVRERFPLISRATVYNTLDALTKAGMILRLNVDPAAGRYDADLEPHSHFRCRVCQKVYDIEVKSGRPNDIHADGHLIESIRTYAYGVCAACRAREEIVPPPTNRKGSFQRKKELQTPSSSGPPGKSEEVRNA